MTANPVPLTGDRERAEDVKLSRTVKPPTIRRHDCNRVYGNVYIARLHPA